MFGRENIVGVLLLVLCGVVASILMYSIVTGEQIDFDLPPFVTNVLGIAFIGLLVLGFVRSGFFRRLRGGQGGQQWPNPGTGQRSLWDRLRGR
ncbi:MAG: hypothetical protein QM753_02775 [Thermomicrobiales bacterium]